MYPLLQFFSLHFCQNYVFIFFFFCGGCSSFWGRVVFRITLTSGTGIIGMCHHTKLFLLATLDIKRSFLNFNQICNLFLWACWCRLVNLTEGQGCWNRKVGIVCDIDWDQGHSWAMSVYWDSLSKFKFKVGWSCSSC